LCLDVVGAHFHRLLSCSFAAQILASMENAFAILLKTELAAISRADDSYLDDGAASAGRGGAFRCGALRRGASVGIETRMSSRGTRDPTWRGFRRTLEGKSTLQRSLAPTGNYANVARLEPIPLSNRWRDDVRRVKRLLIAATVGDDRCIKSSVVRLILLGNHNPTAGFAVDDIGAAEAVALVVVGVVVRAVGEEAIPIN